MIDRFKKLGQKVITCNPQYCKERHESPVMGGLAHTPAEMYKLIEQGIPVSAGNTQLNANQGIANPTWDIPLERRRNVDICDIWTRQQTARTNLRNAGKKISEQSSTE